MEPARIRKQLWFLFFGIFIIVVIIGISIIYFAEHDSDTRTGLYMTICGGIVLIVLAFQGYRRE